MTLRALISLGWTLSINELRQLGMTLDEARAAIHEQFAPPPTPEELALIEEERKRQDEIEWGRKNQHAMASLMGAVGIVRPPVTRRADA